MPDDGEIITPSDTAFIWREDDSITQRRRRERKTLIWTTCVGAALALLVLGHAFGVSWLVSAVARGAATVYP